MLTEKNKMRSTTQSCKYMNKLCEVNQVTGSSTIQISIICKVNIFSLSHLTIRREATKECGKRRYSHYNQKSSNLNYYSSCEVRHIHYDELEC